MIAALALVMTTTLASGAAAVEEAWCARGRALLDGAPTSGDAALARFDQAAAELFAPGSAVVARARSVFGEDADFTQAFAVLSAATAEACAARSDVDPAVSAARVSELMANDARFAGVRRGDDLLDRLRHRFFMWLSRLLETEGMQRFAGGTRTVFFAALAAVALFFSVRVALRLRRRDVEPGASAARIEAARAQAFALLRAQAAASLERRDARGALLAGERALLARVGEHDARAVRPARTHREIVADLSPAIAQAVAPALGAFDVALFARDATVDDAARFLGLVDEAAARVSAAASMPARPA